MPRLSKIGAACLSAFGFGTGGANAVTANYLIVAGGAGGGASTGGGGGAGGVVTNTTSLVLTSTYTVIVGAGGTGGINNTVGTNGSNSTFSAIATAAVGGGGGGGDGSTRPPLTGGSGGGGGWNSSGAAGTSGQGYAGGNGANGPTYYSTGGGGGAGGAGGNASGTVAASGAGGVGISSSITGTATYYAGGGGGGADAFRGGTAGAGGLGGGGAGGVSTTGTSGTANTGGGGGGGTDNVSPYTGGSGGSGVVIVAYAGAQKFGGGIVSYDGTNTIHTFKTSGQLVPMTPITASYLIVAGGGAGGSRIGGGGGAGGLLTGSTLSIDTSSTYLVTVGAGGAAVSSTPGTIGSNGTASSFSIVSTTAVGGGGGGAYIVTTGTVGQNGGSGGGGSVLPNSAGGTGTSGQGNAGGSGGGTYAGGGGGGAGAVGTAGSGSSSVGGAGGIGVQSSITGTATYYAGGGGGSGDAAGGTGGTGGGGNGGITTGNATAGTANTGGGGGGARNSTDTTNVFSGAGGSGVVVISYAGTTQLMAGGTVTIRGGNVIHTFTSSGYLTPLTFIGRSLRFRSSASASISRTPTTAGNQKTWTFSAWVKRGQLTRLQKMFEFGANTSNYITMLWNGAGGGAGADQLDIYANSGGTMAAYLDSVALYRDPAAWYHIVFAVDTTQATASNRLKLYVNGNQITSFASASYPTQNADLFANSAVLHRIGNSSTGGTGQEFDGYMADVRLIDGQQLTPNSFGTFNSYGVWQPINYGGSYGTNGFHLPFNGADGSTYAGSFNGSSKYLTVANNTAFDFGSGNFTVEFWMKPANTAASYTGLFSKRTNNASFYSPVQVLYYNGQLMLFASTTGSSWAVNATQTGSLSANTWYHVAAVRNGTTLTLYVNGNAVASGTVSGALTTNTNLQAIGADSSAGEGLFSGEISNFRMVKGTAVYTGNFIPPTTALTAVSGTSFLTLQDSTVIDNSTNALSITNNGTITTASVTPFTNTTLLLADKSPQGNNWTPNNISLVNGSTYDSMTDVPTLTSATAANYCVMNPLDKGSGLTLSNGNLTVSGTTSSVRGSFGLSTGKWYWEVTIGTVGNPIGIMKAQGNLGAYPGSDAYGWGYNDDGNKYTNGAATAYGATYTSGNVIGIAFDADNGTLTYYKNGTSQGTAFTGLTSGPYFPAVGAALMNLNFGQQPFAYTPPTGFVALNTYNL